MGGREGTQKTATRTVTFKITDKLEKRASKQAVVPAPGVRGQARDLSIWRERRLLIIPATVRARPAWDMWVPVPTRQPAVP